MAVVDGHGLPIGLTIHSASPAEVTLVEEVVRTITGRRPRRMIGDKAFDSDALDHRMADQFGIEFIAPHRQNRRHLTQDGRPLRRYLRRWKVERFFAWLGNFWRLT